MIARGGRTGLADRRRPIDLGWSCALLVLLGGLTVVPPVLARQQQRPHLGPHTPATIGDAWYRHGIRHYRAGRNFEAERSFAQALIHDPAHRLARYYYAWCLVQRGFIGDARSHIIYLIQMWPGEEQYLTMLAHIDRLAPHYAPAASTVASAEQRPPPSPTACLEHAESLRGAGRLAEAEAQLARACAAYPAHDEIRFQYARALVARNDLAAAREIAAPLAGTPFVHDIRYRVLRRHLARMSAAAERAARAGSGTLLLPLKVQPAEVTSRSGSVASPAGSGAGPGSAVGPGPLPPPPLPPPDLPTVLPGTAGTDRVIPDGLPGAGGR